MNNKFCYSEKESADLMKRAKKPTQNSPEFDKASYEAAGGSNWMDSRRELFFDRDKAKDKSLWDRAEVASQSSLGKRDVKFIVWYYLKQGGSF